MAADRRDLHAEHRRLPGRHVAGLPDAADPAVAQLMSIWVGASCRGSGAAEALVDGAAEIEMTREPG